VDGHGPGLDLAQAFLRLNEEVMGVLRRMLLLVPAAGDRERREREGGANPSRRRA